MGVAAGEKFTLILHTNLMLVEPEIHYACDTVVQKLNDLSRKWLVNE